MRPRDYLRLFVALVITVASIVAAVVIVVEPCILVGWPMVFISGPVGLMVYLLGLTAGAQFMDSVR